MLRQMTGQMTLSSVTCCSHAPGKGAGGEIKAHFHLSEGHEKPLGVLGQGCVPCAESPVVMSGRTHQDIFQFMKDSMLNETN